MNTTRFKDALSNQGPIYLRAWNPRNKAMIYFELSLINEFTFRELILPDIDKVIFMRYTGIFDNIDSGMPRKVYEGDIIEIQGDYFVIVWDGINFKWVMQTDYHLYDLSRLRAYEGVIKGNVFENPKLLEG